MESADVTAPWPSGVEMGISERYIDVSMQIKEACIESGREASNCLLLAVSKTVGLDGVAQAIDAGALDFGENRPDEIVKKYAAFPEARWHFIGNIQSRRIKDIVKCSHLIHSLYKLDHAKKIDAVAAELGKVQDVLLEVNVSGEESKSGMEADDVAEFIEACSGFSHIRLRGLMTMAPQGNLQIAQQTFAKLRELKDELSASAKSPTSANLDAFDQLSMGMSEDWKEAIMEGSTIVRIGRAIFSDDF